MPNGTYGGMRGTETKVGQKTFVSRPTRLSVMSELPYIYCPHVSLVATSIAWAKERQEWKTQTSAVRGTTGQSWRMLLVGRQGRAASGFGKNHPRPEGCGIFPENLAFPEASAAGPS